MLKLKCRLLRGRFLSHAVAQCNRGRISQHLGHIPVEIHVICCKMDGFSCACPFQCSCVVAGYTLVAIGIFAVSRPYYIGIQNVGGHINIV